MYLFIFNSLNLCLLSSNNKTRSPKRPTTMCQSQKRPYFTTGNFFFLDTPHHIDTYNKYYICNPHYLQAQKAIKNLHALGREQQIEENNVYLLLLLLLLFYHYHCCCFDEIT